MESDFSKESHSADLSAFEKASHDENIDPQGAETITGGVDVGSVSSQAVIMVDGKVYAYSNMRTGSDSPDSARNAMNWAMEPCTPASAPAC